MATAEPKLARPEFTNEPFTDYSVPENRRAMEDALAKVKGELGREYPILIGGEKSTASEKTKSINPSHPEQVVGVFQKGTPELAKQAVQVAAKAFESWKKVSPEQRAEYLFRTAEILRRRKHEMSA